MMPLDYLVRTCGECGHGCKLGVAAKILAGTIIATDLECRYNPPGIMMLPTPSGTLQLVVSYLPVKDEMPACAHFYDVKESVDPAPPE